MAGVVRWGVGEPVRGSGCRVRVGVVVRGGVLERLLRGVPPMGEGNVWLFRQGDGGSGNEVDVLPSIVWLFVGG